MAQQYFEIERGVELDGIQFLAGAGVPGAAGDPSTVALGSFYLDTTNGDMYVKKTTGVGTDKWKRLARAEEAGTSLSWREPVLVRDNTLYADITAAETAANVADLVDGVTIAANDRLLFDNLTSGNENVYIVSGSTGSWTFTNSANAESDGDTVYTQSGTDAGIRFTYNGTTWVRTDESSQDELGFVRTFIGKTGAGSETPTFSSTNHVTTTNSLETAIGDLDAALGADVASGEYLTNGDAVGTSLDNLNDGLEDARLERTSLNITAITTVNVALVDTYAAVYWEVDFHGNLEADAAKIRNIHIIARHNGHNVGSGLDATDVDFSVYGKIKFGNITGLSITVDLDGTGGSQFMRLRITSTTAVDCRLIRRVIKF